MSIISEISSREAYPVHIGTITLFCERFQLTGTRQFSETASVDGTDIITNSSRKALKITFEGRIPFEQFPLYSAADADDILYLGTASDVEYRGIVFPQCRILSFSFKDEGEDFIRCVITVYTAEKSERSVNDIGGYSNS